MTLKANHKGVDYYFLTSDPQDGPRTRAGRKWSKRHTAKRQRRDGAAEAQAQSEDESFAAIAREVAAHCPRDWGGRCESCDTTEAAIRLGLEQSAAGQISPLDLDTLDFD
jgi:hypothetical protein